MKHLLKEYSTFSEMRLREVVTEAIKSFPPVKVNAELLEAFKMNGIYASAAIESQRLHKHGTSIIPIINGFIECLRNNIKRGEAAIAKAEGVK